MAGFTQRVVENERQRDAMFDLSHGRCLRIDILETRVREARGRCDTEHASLDVKFEDALGTSSAFKSILNSVTDFTGTIDADILL